MTIEEPNYKTVRFVPFTPEDWTVSFDRLIAAYPSGTVSN